MNSSAKFFVVFLVTTLVLASGFILYNLYAPNTEPIEVSPPFITPNIVHTVPYNEIQHVHTDDCYELRPVLVCLIDDPEHEHNEDCYLETRQVVCGQEISSVEDIIPEDHKGDSD